MTGVALGEVLNSPIHFTKRHTPDALHLPLPLAMTNSSSFANSSHFANSSLTTGKNSLAVSNSSFPSATHQANVSFSSMASHSSLSLTPELIRTSGYRSSDIAPAPTLRGDLTSRASTFQTVTTSNTWVAGKSLAPAATGTASSNSSRIFFNQTVGHADFYRSYSGDGSIAAGWPSMHSWVGFNYM